MTKSSHHDPAHKPSDRDRLRQISLFAALPDEVLDQLLSDTWTRKYPSGQILTTEGDPGDSLLIIESGVVRIVRWGPVGQEIVLATVGAPQAIGELALIDGAPRSATIVAHEPVEVRIVPRALFQGLLQRDPDTALRVMRALASMVRSTNERLSDLLTLDVPGRVAKWLLANQHPDGTHAVVQMSMSQSDLASELGTTRVTINRTLKTFESLGAIKMRGEQIEILKPEDLRSRIG